jgi:hypothetical protein
MLLGSIILVPEACLNPRVQVFTLLKLWTVFIAAALRILPEFSVFCQTK